MQRHKGFTRMLSLVIERSMRVTPLGFYFLNELEKYFEVLFFFNFDQSQTFSEDVEGSKHTKKPQTDKPTY